MKNKKEKQAKSISFFCLHLAGIYGILFFLSAIEGISFSVKLVGGVIFLVCAGNWYLYMYKRKVCWYFYFIELGVIIGLGYFFRKVLYKQIQFAAERLMQVEETDPVDLTFLILIILLYLCLLLFFLEFTFIGHKWMIVVITGLFCIAPVVGIAMQWKTAAVLFFFQVIFYAVHKLEQKNRKTVLLSVEQLSGKTKKASDAVTLSMTVLLGTLFCAAVLIAQIWKEPIYHLTYDLEGYLYRIAVNTLGIREKPVKDGKVSRTNLHRTGEEQMQIWTEQKPTEPLYLSGFHGENYIGGDWTAADNRKLYEEIANQLNLTHWENHMGSTYSGMYYVVNSRMKGDPMKKSRNLQIEPINKRDATYYRPYYSQWQGDAANNYFDYGRYESGYQYRYYEQKDMEIDWENVNADFKESASYYLEIQTIYQQAANHVYTQVPGEILPKLSKLCRENPFSELEEITAFILYTLHSNAVYTVTPGTAPYGEDIVEYFLFENGRGYCVHFAAAATLMYRMYGIPARYVSGYLIEPTEFEQQRDGRYLAEVTDRAAHAWVEILVEDYGWTPVEVTPAAGNIERADTDEIYLGWNQEEMNAVFQKYGWDLSVPSIRRIEQEEKSMPGKKKQQNLDWNPIWFFLPVEVLCLIPLAVRYWRFFRWEKIKQKGSRGIFFELLRILHLGGYLSKYEGWEEDFSIKLSEQIPGIEAEKMEQVIEIVNRAAYGNGKESDKDREYVFLVYQKVTLEVCSMARGWKRMVVRFFC